MERVVAVPEILDEPQRQTFETEGQIAFGLCVEVNRFVSQVTEGNFALQFYLRVCFPVEERCVSQIRFGNQIASLNRSHGCPGAQYGQSLCESLHLSGQRFGEGLEQSSPVARHLFTECASGLQQMRGLLCGSIGRGFAAGCTQRLAWRIPILADQCAVEAFAPIRPWQEVSL